jgi:3-deoxy-manno-octulosonate cytidylyltransferase (CMP-KDO synthetase)
MRLRKKTNSEVFVATPDQKIIDVVNQNKGKAILTSINHQTGTDRVYEVFKDHLNSEPNLIVNLQGDMPNIDPQAISDLINYMQKGNCDIGTLASSFSSDNELADENNVKVVVKEKLTNGKFSEALDFFRKDSNEYENYYHHVGIYAFTNKALVRYVSLKRSKLELERKLEQLRAIENSMSIHAGYINSSPLSVDTKNDLIEVRKIMEINN